ncbi:DUF378 domain-containing protein [Variovorax sp. J22P271]|uniref:DUF378 domain-containing protein n=1 Tax=Variovorax davisae TaxID=3053515 RepID=UPI00257870E4|nr:DUF378 domain-containing protein [Variovorax sp. J22P271]MDM0032157.1 DUF378 domain-containing protein [Variovorax sp. J22P271]
MPITREDLTRGIAPRLRLSAIDWIAMVLMIVGAVNWGLLGALNVDLVSALFGSMTMISRVVYVLVGAAGLYGIFTLVWPRKQ